MSLEGDDENFFDTVTLGSRDGRTTVTFCGGTTRTEIRVGSRIIVVMETIATGEWYNPPTDCRPPEPSAP